MADSSKFPDDWLFKHRWGKGKKDAATTLPNGAKITFLTVGGRTSCIAPSIQIKTGPVAADVSVKAEDDSSELEEAKPALKKRKVASNKDVKVKVDEDEDEESEEKMPAPKKRRVNTKQKIKVKTDEDEASESEETMPTPKNRKISTKDIIRDGTDTVAKGKPAVKARASLGEPRKLTKTNKREASAFTATNDVVEEQINKRRSGRLSKG